MCTSKAAYRTNRQADLLGLHHRGIAIHAKNVYLFGCSHAVATAGADIFASVARLWRRCSCGGVSVPRAAWRVAPFDSVHVDVRPALLNDEVAEGFGRLRDAPSDSWIIADRQVAGGGRIPEFFVVICPASAAILYSILQVPKMYHFMQ